MAYLSYTGLPVYFGSGITFPGSQADTQSRGVYCQQVTLSNTPNIAVNKTLGTTPDVNSYILAGPPNNTLSLSFLLGPNAGGTSAEFSPFDYTGDKNTAGTTFRIGDNTHGLSGSGAYLTSMSFTVAPYTPVSCQADFAIYSPLVKSGKNPSMTGGRLVGASVGTQAAVDELDAGQMVHGAYCQINGESLLTGMDNIESIQYSYSINRLPVYELGLLDPTSVETVSHEETITIAGNNITQLIGPTGLAMGGVVGVTLKTPRNQTVKEVNVNGRMTAQNVSVAAGDFGRGSVTISRTFK